MTDLKPFFSIIVPTYNAEKTIVTAIDSVIKQSFNNWELIIVDDLSLDSTRVILSKITHNNIRIIYNKQNVGVSESRNIGIRNAKGKYLLFLDSDDFYQESLFSYLYDQINNNYINVDLIKFGFYEKYSYDGKESLYPINLRSALYTERSDILQCIIKLEKEPAFGYVWNSVYKNSLIFENNLFFNKNISINEDFCFNIDYINKSSSIACLPFNGYFYIKTNSNLSSSDENYLSLSLMKIDIFVSLLGGINKKLYEDIFWMYVRFIYSNFTRGKCSYTEVRQTLNGIFNSKLFNIFKSVKFYNISFKQRIMIYFLRNKMVIPLFFMTKIFKFLKSTFPVVFSIVKR